MATINASPKGVQRLTPPESQQVGIQVDGLRVFARRGETVLLALNAALGHVRNFEFCDERRAGFCFMGACQDCWVWTAAGERIRACTSLVEQGMKLSTSATGRIA